MISSGTCGCGRPADSFGGLCDRCVALRTLGLVTTASAEQIEDAYLTLVKVWHPDRFQSDPRLRQAAEEKLKEINAAHDYLVCGPPAAGPAAAIRRPDSTISQAEASGETSELLERTTTPFVHDPEAEEPEEVRRILQRYQKQKSTVPHALITSSFALGTVAVFALLWFSVDAFLSSNQSTSLAWARKKSELSLDLVRLWSGATANLESSSSQIAPAQAPDPSQADPLSAPPPAAIPQRKGTGEHGKGSAQTVATPGHTTGAQPYITAGLSPAEVLAVLGNPTTSSGEKMFYKGSEIDFQNGRVVGWKIDPKSAPLRVKLWSNMAPVPGLTTFGLGSSKSDVITLQGTPNLFSRNEFGYGGSVVFFQNDRVTGWKEDPASVRLKVAQ